MTSCLEEPYARESIITVKGRWGSSEKMKLVSGDTLALPSLVAVWERPEMGGWRGLNRVTGR